MKRDIKQNQKSNGLKIAIIAIAILIVGALIVGAFVNLAQKQSGLTTPTITQNTAESQIINVKVQGSNYVLTPSTFEMGQQVTLVFDMSTVVGCSRTVVIPEFGVRKSLSSNDNTISFTPSKAGTFRIQCSMNMYGGSFTVTSDGSNVAQTQSVTQNTVQIQEVQQPTQMAGGGSCGAGCGCGGMK